ncbi:preprotein translocase subunit SecE [Candidatus Parcubacteria bacterium]|nr:preprotein translocase subunit SecE [Candidatus Parcubacteria bacterium]
MAEGDNQKPRRRIRQEKTKPSMRELGKIPEKVKKPGRIRKVGSKVSSPLNKPFNKLRSLYGREYLFLKLPENKAGKILNKRVRIVPQFLKNAWAEIRQTSWPNRHETIRLSFAVFVFATIFAVIISLLDLGLDKLFREFIIKV